MNLTSDVSLAQPGQKVRLTATSAANVTGTDKSIEIFDMTTGTVAAACMQGSQCTVDYSATPSIHEFAAFVGVPVKSPPGAAANGSNHLKVGWVGVSLASNVSAVGPGKSVTVNAQASVVSPGVMIQIFDADSGARLAYCVHGTSCGVTVASAEAGMRQLIAILGPASTALPVTGAQAQSDRLPITWLAAAITASSSMQIGANIGLTASTNADLTNTPWSLGIMDDHGHLVGQPCKSGNQCTAQLPLAAGPTPTFTAVIGRVAPPPHAANKIAALLQTVAGPTTLVDIQAQSQPAKPIRMLWGVDSCKSFTDDAGASSGLYPAISGVLGAPDFWGRYLTNTVCPGLSPTEIAAAHAKHMGILPIYNDYNCSNVSGYGTGLQYAAEAVAAARSLGIPQYRGLAIDIEPPGDACPGAANVDTGFIHGWYDGISAANYEPIFYADATAGSAFATQWCYAVQALPYIGQKAYLWSFQPSLFGGYMKSNAPGFGPNLTGCVGYVHGWQYQLGSSSSTPDVDGDEVTSEMPLWFP